MSVAEKPTLAERLTALKTARDEIADLNQEVKRLKQQYEQLQHELLSELDETGLTSLSGAGLTAFKTTEVVYRPKGNDWSKLYEFISDRNYFHLLQRRVSNPAFRELAELGELPEDLMECYEQDKLNLRKT